MLRRVFALAATLLGACATQPPPPPPAPEPPPPVIISDQAQPETAAEPVVTEALTVPQMPKQTDAGRFRVGVVSLETTEATAPWVSKLQAAGYRTEVLPVTIDGKTWHRVLLPGYANLEEARGVIPFVEQEFGITGVWVTSRRRAPTPSGAPAAAADPAAEPAPAATPPAPEPESPPAS